MNIQKTKQNPVKLAICWLVVLYYELFKSKELEKYKLQARAGIVSIGARYKKYFESKEYVVNYKMLKAWIGEYEVNNKTYLKYIATGQVPQKQLTKLAYKIARKEKLTSQETEIFSGCVREINEIISKFPTNSLIDKLPANVDLFV